eukprot:11409123-Karenia_brevis.AAC.1
MQAAEQAVAAAEVRRAEAVAAAKVAQEELDYLTSTTVAASDGNGCVIGSGEDGNMAVVEGARALLDSLEGQWRLADEKTGSLPEKLLEQMCALRQAVESIAPAPSVDMTLDGEAAEMEDSVGEASSGEKRDAQSGDICAQDASLKRVRVSGLVDELNAAGTEADDATYASI